MATRIARFVAFVALVFGCAGAFGAPNVQAAERFGFIVYDANDGRPIGDITFIDNGDDSTTVAISVQAVVRAQASLHEGTVERYNDRAAYILDDVVDGHSVTLLKVPLKELQAQGLIVILRDAGGIVLASGSLWLG